MHRDRQITPSQKCLGHGCPIWARCWRFLAPPHPYTQRYLEPRFSLETASCPDQWAVRKYDADVFAGRTQGDHTLHTGAAPSSRGRGVAE